MKSKKVRVGAKYIYQPVLFDVLNGPVNHNLKNGDVVTVVNLRGAPKANTMGMCYVNLSDGSFGGMVMTNSLESIK